MRKNIKRLIIISIICTSSLVVGCNLIPEESMVAPVLAKTKDIEYNTAVVTRGDLAQKDSSYGFIESHKRHFIYSSNEGGRMEEKYFDVWDEVKEGETVAKLYTKDLDNEIALQELKLKRAQLNYEKLNNSSSNEYDIEIALIELQYEKEKLNTLINLRESKIYRSPIDGIISEITSANRSDEIFGGDVIAVVEESGELVLNVTKLNEDIDIYYEGMEVIIEHEGLDYAGEVIEVNREYDSSTSTSKGVRIMFKDKAPDGLALNKKIYYEAIGRSKNDVLIIPTNALYLGEDVNYVFVLIDGIKVKKIVEVGMSTSEYTEIISGLEENEVVILK